MNSESYRNLKAPQIIKMKKPELSAAERMARAYDRRVDDVIKSESKAN